MSVCSIQKSDILRSLGASHHRSLHVASQYSAIEPVLGGVIDPPSRALGGELGTDLTVFLQATRIKAPAAVLTLIQLGVGCTHPKSKFCVHLNEGIHLFNMWQIENRLH
jgi:hypothetical protein